MVPASDRGDDPVGIGGPDKRLGIVIGLGEEAVDSGLEVDQGRCPVSAAFRQLGEETLDGIEPRGRFWDVVEHEMRMAIEPGAHLGCLWLP